MPYTQVQTKLNQAITTNADGDYAVRTVIEGAQTLDSLTVTDLTNAGDQNGGGNYLLNEQTTTNMMSKGAVYRFDGVDDVITITDNADMQIGTSDFAIGFKINYGGAQTTEGVLEWYTDGNNRLSIYFDSDGYLNMLGKVGGVDVIAAEYQSVLTAGEYNIFIICDRDTSNYIYINGVAVTLGINTKDNGATDFNLGNWTIGESINSSDFFDGSFSAFSLFNFAPTAAEVKDLISGNIPFKWQYGSQTAIYTSDFSAGTDSWASNSNCTVDGNIDSIGGKDNNLRMTLSGGSTSHSMKRTTPTLTVGKRYKLTFDYYIPSANSAMDSFGVYDGNGASIQNDFGGLDSWESVDIDFTATHADYIRIYARDGGASTVNGDGDLLYVRNFSTIPLGAVALYTQDSITANNWFDLANGNTGAVTGASVLNPKGIAVDEDNIPVFSVTSGITAAVGSAQGDGVLTSSINQIATCGTAGDAVTLPAAKPGKVLWITNDGAESADVFPASGDNIDEAGANAAKALPADGEMQFICTSAGHWTTITSA